MDIGYYEKKLAGYNKYCCELIRKIEAMKLDNFVKVKEISQPVAVPCVPQVCNVQYLSTACQKKEKEEEMITATIDHGNDQAKSYLRQRARDIKEAKKTEAQRAFGLRDDQAPKTANELISRIKDGKFVIPKDYENEKDYNQGLGYIRWRDPAKIEDKAGYELAAAALDKQYTATKDTIIVMEPAAGLAAVQAFESATIH